MSSVASSIPLALSLLHTVATQYPGLTKSQPTTSTAVPPAPPPPPTFSIALPPLFPSAGAGTAANPPNASTQSSASAAAASVAVTPPANSTSPMCEHCHLKPKYNDGTKTHSYCSKSCAAAAKASGNSNSTSTTNGATGSNSANCDFCHVRPKHPGHPFCGKACARNAGASGAGRTNGGAKGTCHAPGCSKPTHVNADGTCGDYCSLSHRTLGETLCLLCFQAAKRSNSNFCSKKCSDDAEAKGPMLLEVPVGHATLKSVSEQFKASWRHPGTKCPSVKHVYKVVSTQASLAAYNAYKANVEAQGQFLAAGRSEGNENRRWHGTRRECHLGDQGQTQFCNSPTCSLCCIIKTSFNLSFWGKKTGWGRFGKGIYTSSTSSKSNDYSHNDCVSPLKAILLNKVVVGKGCKMTQDNVTLTAPPSGYDSVLAEKGGSLNYDELVVYTEDAIRPSFLVMYEA